MGYIGNQPGQTNFGSVPSKSITPPVYNVTLADSNYMLLADCTAGDITINLPAVDTVPTGFAVYVKKIDTSVHTAIITGNGGQDINGQGTRTVVNQWDGIGISANLSNTAWYSFTSSGSNPGSGGGGGSLASLSDVNLSSPTNGQVLEYNGTVWVNSSAAVSGFPFAAFDIGLNNSTSLLLSTSTLTNSYQYTGTGSAIVYGVIATNVTGSENTYISAAILDNVTTDTFYYGYQIPIQENTSVELFRRPKVLKHNDQLQFQSEFGNDVTLAIRYVEYPSDTSLFKVVFNAGSSAVSSFQSFYTEANTLGSVIESLVVANVNGVSPVQVSIKLIDGLANPQLISSLTVPAGTSIEICEVALVTKNTQQLEVQVSVANYAQITMSGRAI